MNLTAFIAAVLGKPVLYRSGDPLDALEIAIFGDGDELGWHFDNSEFSVTVMYQQAEAGGHFDYYPRLRMARAARSQPTDAAARRAPSSQRHLRAIVISVSLTHLGSASTIH